MPAEVLDRDALLAAYQVDGPLDEPDLRSVAELATHVCAVPYAVVNLISEHFQHQVAAVGITPSVCARGDAMCAVTIGEPEPVEVPDARDDPRFAANPFVTGRLGLVRFYAASQLRSPSGAVLGTLCVFDETTGALTAPQRHALDLLAGQAVAALELRRAYRALTATVRDLADARVELERSNGQLAAFAGQVSHDLRNPLAGVTGFLELLADHPAVAGETTARRHVERALAAAGRMRAMVDDLLAYARVGGTLSTGRVDLGVLLREVLDDVPPGTFDAARLDLGVLPTVRGDTTQLRAVLANVVANAVRCARPDRPLVLRTRARPAGDRWIVEIADNGIGVPPERREEAFELLRQVHEPGTVAGGSGIGLATCRRIVSAHGGSISLDDGLDGGTAVTITLPSA
ncbi:sensor histidine kinase [Actinomycetospora cinnamomea]|uniref:Sensor-like histidine kinase SenX3 n=1 Tax=Actinomycetospora cinnamomea TaxID=663609 RepID=A0A2U1FR06_9PSEU|nr:GAF domain-containing sensor histidine kinase [Actinomycetospora cinnamomea]PVZ14574.1 GAF sensor signal transduction histidine kinase [Actinomycetospora cinnamomea]